ncbi:HPF/RaiA family ribosome-associated protein [Teichococcus vastitatis]|uniref:HPF/RaiA family ribosome-associated protein n=1 Tax=Teichococcus vastitatis TaxID=2307076 RepID=A0ABS9W6B7_9PROT|nr:HPF/RaiA family ribosome-associated protein [Pseudoroseomonas vastitatis]MCI0754836.1 HPF/RaiA family ribosome-associated protein [Pseudoroseomonas vastitatis]
MASSVWSDRPENTRVAVEGHQLEMGDALKANAAARVRTMAAKYFGRAADATVIFSRHAKGWGFCCNIRFRVAGAIDFDGRAMHRDAHAALTMALEHVAKQLRRRKRAIREDKPANLIKDNLFRQHSEPVVEHDEVLGLLNDSMEDDEMFVTALSAKSPAYRSDLPLAAE